MANNAMAIVMYGILAVVVAMSIVIFFPIDCTITNKVEGFSVQPGPKVCPVGTTMFIDKQGNTNCCDGQVTGSMCEGAIECTFSSGLPSIPFCGAGRVKRYDGDIWPMVKNLFNQGPDSRKIFTQNVMPIFKNIINILQRNVPGTISKKSYDAVVALQEDENVWLSTLDTLPPREVRSRILYEEETMRIITKTLEVLQSEPIAKDPLKLAAKIQQETCK